MTTDAQALLDATRLFLRRHEQALASGDPQRAHAACTGILEAIAQTLPEEIDRIGGESAARAVLDKRMAEVEGLALQLRLALEGLERRETDILRLVALLTALRRTLRALDQALALFLQLHAPSVETFDALRAARECLVAHIPRAAVEALAPALRAALAEPLGLPSGTPVADSLDAWAKGEPRFDVAEARRLDATLAQGGEDAVAAWSLLDAVERVANQAAMSPRS